MPYITAQRYDTKAIKQWLDANGVRWHLPEDAAIVVKGNVAHTERFLIRIDQPEKLRGKHPGWDRRVFEFEDGHPVEIKRKPYRFRIRYPLSQYL